VMTVTSTQMRSGDRGDVAPLVVLTPITVFLVMLVIQMGLFFHARSIVAAAAQDGARAAQLEGGTEADARLAAAQILAGSESLLINEQVIVVSDEDEVTVTITADLNSLVPFWDGSLSASATGPKERFRNPSERGSS
jgi:Flp pilus assembly protein TadG